MRTLSKTTSACAAGGQLTMRAVEPVNWGLRMVHCGRSQVNIVTTADELIKCRTMEWQCPYDVTEALEYGGSNLWLHITRIPVYITVGKGFPHVQTIEGTARRLCQGQQQRSIKRKTALRSGGSGNIMRLVSPSASIVFFRSFVTIPPWPLETQSSSTHEAICLISFGTIQVGF